MAYNEQLAERVRQFFKTTPERIEEKRMMGGLCFMVNGKMCVGVDHERLMVRIDPEHYEAALRRNGCTPMDFTGRPMRGFVFVNLEGLQTPEQLKSWLELALAFNPKAKVSKSRSTTPRQKRSRSN